MTRNPFILLFHRTFKYAPVLILLTIAAVQSATAQQTAAKPKSVGLSSTRLERIAGRRPAQR
jgi:hypothetical protein